MPLITSIVQYLAQIAELTYTHSHCLIGDFARKGGRVVDGTGLENQQMKVSWVRIPPLPPNSMPQLTLGHTICGMGGGRTVGSVDEERRHATELARAYDEHHREVAQPQPHPEDR